MALFVYISACTTHACMHNANTPIYQQRALAEGTELVGTALCLLIPVFAHGSDYN